MKNKPFLLFLCLLCAAVAPAQPGSKTKTVYIDPDMPPNPPEKPGYLLVAWDEFDAPQIDTTRWSRSGDIDPDNCPSRCFDAADPGNVVLENGVCRLLVTPSASGPCDVSTAEIKSFRFQAGGFRSWHIEPGSYLEIRAKLAHGGRVGCAGWLYTQWVEGNIYREIDIWETSHDDDTRFQINRHFGAPGAGDPFRVHVRDREGNKVHLSEHFLTFGVQWDANNVGFYLNGKFVAEYCCFDPGQQLNWPLSLLLGAGRPSLADECPVAAELPQAMEVDYVRYYRPADRHPLRLVKVTDTVAIDAQSQTFACCPQVWVNYMPGVVYEALSPAASFDEWPHVLDNQAWGFTPLPGLPLNAVYPLDIVARFPPPHAYTDTLHSSFYLSDGHSLSFDTPDYLAPDPVPPVKIYPTLLRSGESLRIESPYFYNRLQIVGADGRVVLTEPVVREITRVDMPAGLSPGVYFVKMLGDCGLWSGRIVLR
ncbi:MAG: glycoside hydrolase family 16 protein [Saprospiraceae bacterium]|nr:glycoside hydrolase family 16 protein [Saprospiraceae bacterium]